MIIIMFGAPGVGKGTQAVILANKLGVAHLSTGDAFRTAIENQSAVGVIAKEFVDAGKLVSDEIVARIVEEAMQGQPYANGCILDGFPRTQAQADALDIMLEGRGLAISSVVNLNVDDATIVSRLLLRGRSDDKEDIIRHRLKVYNGETEPLLDFYSAKGLLTSVDGIGDVDAVGERILQAISGQQ